jgi:hypothetical protein
MCRDDQLTKKKQQINNMCMLILGLTHELRQSKADPIKIQNTAYQLSNMSPYPSSLQSNQFTLSPSSTESQISNQVRNTFSLPYAAFPNQPYVPNQQNQTNCGSFLRQDHL